MNSNAKLGKLKYLFEPRSVALVGQSGAITDVYDVTTAPMLYLLKYNYPGIIFPVNPKYQEISGYKCYPTVSSIPDPVDAVLFIVPADRVVPLLEECGEKGIQAAIVTSSGFAETGERGQEEQRKIRGITEKYGMVVLGPNCNGMVNVIKGISLSFTPVLEGEKLAPGNIGFVSQSGATLSGIGTRAKEKGVGFSYLVGTGNEADVDLVDCVQYMVEDSHTQVIMALVEGIKDGRRFLEVADRALEKQKPIVVLKLGQSEVGKQSALSHTGNLSGSAKVNEAAFRQKGILTVDEVNEFIESARIFTQTALPKGDGIGVVSTSGGSAGLAADLIHKHRLRVGCLSKQSLDDLSKMIRWFATAKNPFDFAGQFLRDESFPRKVFDLFLKDEDIHLLLVVMTPVQKHDFIIMREAIASGKQWKKPVVILYVGGKLDPDSERLVSTSNVPFFTSPNECVKAIENLIRYSTYLHKKKGKPPQTSASVPSPSGREFVSKWFSERNRKITEREAKLLLSHYGIPVTREVLASNVEEAGKAGQTLGFPVALKIESPDILHKTEAGGVRLHLRNEEELRGAFNEMILTVRDRYPEAEIRGLLVQEMVSQKAVEAIVGISRDPQYGPTIMFGLGGVLVEVLEDIALRICPITEEDAREMIQEIKGFKVLRGFRGGAKADLEATAELLVRLSHLAVDLQDKLSEIDINPLMIFPEGKGVVAVDSRMVLT